MAVSTIDNSGISPSAAISTSKLGTGAVLQVQTANYSYNNTVSTTSQMNYSGGTAPTISQGAQIASITFTPLSSSSTLIFSHGGIYNIAAQSNLVSAIFEGSTCIGVTAPRYVTTGEAGFSQMIQLSKASNGVQTYTVRMGPQNATTAYFLSYPTYTVTQALFTIMEVAA
jgi:hypothetical protein